MATLSIIVPVYKTEPYLDQCVQSILCQTFTDFELLLIDDGSPDNCPAMCDAWAQRDKRVRVIHKENGGSWDAVQTGQKAAAGKYTGYVDSDDWVQPDYFEVLVHALETYDADIAACGWTWYAGGEKRGEKVYSDFRRWNREEIERDILQPFWEKDGNLFAAWSNGRWDKVWRTELMMRVLPQMDPKATMGEDAEQNLLYLPLCRSAVRLDAYAGYCCRVNAESMTRRFSEKTIAQNEDYLTALKKIAGEQNRGFAAYASLHDGLMTNMLWQVQEADMPLNEKMRLSRELTRKMLTPVQSTRQKYADLPLPLRVGLREIGNGKIGAGTVWMQLCLLLAHIKNGKI